MVPDQQDLLVLMDRPVWSEAQDYRGPLVFQDLQVTQDSREIVGYQEVLEIQVLPVI